MTRRFLPPLVVPVIVLVLIAPVSASLVLSTVSFIPDAPLVPGGTQQATATYAIIPAGSTTFARGHSLQLQTNLTGAAWSIQVTLDGRNAARQTASGSAAFVNGEILAYPTTRDVGLIVTIDGTVPPDAAGSVVVLTAKELDNGGNAVPGSELTISQPVAGSTISPATTPLPTLTPPVVTTIPPKGSPGFAAPPALLALVATGLVLQAAFRRP
jgi:hypothetical protein